MNQVIGVILFGPKAFRSLFRVSTLKKLLSVTLSFLMLVSIAYTFIETVDPEPSFASGEFDCVDSDGRTYVYQSTWAGNTLTINRGVNDDSGTFVKNNGFQTFDSWSSTSNSNISEVNSLAITTDGEMFALLKESSGSNVKFYKLNYNGSAQHISSISFPDGDNNAASNYEVDVSGTTYKYYISQKVSLMAIYELSESTVMEHIICLNQI